MLAWGANPFQNSLTPLLRDQATKLETIFKSTQFNNLLRQETADVVAFLARDPIVERLLQYTLTEELVDSEQFKRYQSLALTVLCGGKAGLQEKISSNRLLIQKLKAFPDSQFARNPVICGNFSRIVQFLVRATTGEILGSEFGFLPSFLIQNIDLAGARELLFDLMANFTIPFCVSPEMVASLLQQLANPTAVLPTLLLIRDVVGAATELGRLFWGDSCLTLLFQTGVSEYLRNPLVARECFATIGRLADPCRLRFQFNFPFYEVVNCATDAALSVFPEEVARFVCPFFRSELPTILNAAVMTVVRRMTSRQLVELAETTHLCQVAVDSFGTYERGKTNGHFLDGVRIFSERGICCCSAHQKEWKELTKKVRARYKQVMANYGGRTNPEAEYIQKDLFQSMDDLYSILGADDDDVVD
jgi:hypothetical protein